MLRAACKDSVTFIFSFFFNDTATTEIYTLSLHDALPISHHRLVPALQGHLRRRHRADERSEEHTSELQSRVDLVCRLLLEKKNNLTIQRSEIHSRARNRNTSKYFHVS